MWPASVYRPKKNNDNKSVCFYTPFQFSLSSLLFYCYFLQAHEMVRSEILQQILNRVITKATTPVNHYIGKWKFCTIKHYALMNTGVLY